MTYDEFKAILKSIFEARGDFNDRQQSIIAEIQKEKSKTATVADFLLSVRSELSGAESFGPGSVGAEIMSRSGLVNPKARLLFTAKIMPKLYSDLFGEWVCRQIESRAPIEAVAFRSQVDVLMLRDSILDKDVDLTDW